MKKTDSAIERAFKLIRAVAADPDRYPDRFIAIPLDPELTPRLLTPERLRLLKMVRDKGPFSSLNELAHRLDREQSRVSRDVSDLVTMGLLRTKRHGKSKSVEAPKRPIVLT